jgi:hypothetical protein
MGRLLPFSGGRLASSPISFGNGFVFQPGTWFPGEDGRRHRERLNNADTSAAYDANVGEQMKTPQPKKE